MIQGIGFLGFDSWVCIHWFLGLNIISILGKLKISFLSLPYLQSICINNRKWIQIPGFRFLGLDSCVWIPAFGFLGLDSWVWIPGFGVLGLDSWAWIPGLGVLRLGSRAWIPGFRLLARTLLKTLSKPMRFEPILQFLWSPPTIDPRRSGELGPETHFFLQALHKLARALQITLPRWGGLEEIGRDSLILHTRPVE